MSKPVSQSGQRKAVEASSAREPQEGQTSSTAQELVRCPSGPPRCCVASVMTPPRFTPDRPPGITDARLALNGFRVKIERTDAALVQEGSGSVRHRDHGETCCL